MTWLDNQWHDINISSWLVIVNWWVYHRLMGLSTQRRGNPLPSSINQHPLVAAALYLSNRLQQLLRRQWYSQLVAWPHTVALAVPLARQMPQFPPLLITVLTTVILGGLFAVICAVVPPVWCRSCGTENLAAKCHHPIAVGITEQIGGLVTLMVMVVLLTGIIGILVAQRIFRYQHIADERWQGLILGVSAHAIGTT